jgi:hypothetical protein
VQTKSKSSLNPRSSRQTLAVLVLVLVATVTAVGQHASREATTEDLRVAEVSPVGWRRTLRGWERAEDWANRIHEERRDINQWIAFQRAQEPLPAQWMLHCLRSIHPLMYSATLLMFVVGLTVHHESRQAKKVFEIR